MKNFSSLLLALIGSICCANVAQAQVNIIITVAGTDSAGYSGDGGPATAGQLNTPTGLAIDAAGNIYIADADNNRIRKVNTSGLLSTIAGKNKAAYSGDGGAATDASLNYPTSVAVDAAGNIYIADYLNSAIRKISTAGIINTIAGNHVLDSTLDGGFGGYSGDGSPATEAQLNFPIGVYVDNTGNVYIADASNNVVRKIDTSGIITTIVGNHSIGGAYSGDGGTATAAALNDPEGVFVDSAGNVYIADAGNNVVRKVNTSGIITTIVGNYSIGGSYSGNGGPATAAALNSPTGVTVDAAGNLFIADDNNSVIRGVNTSGIISTVAGDYTLGYGFSGDGGPATSSQLNQPFGVALDGSGNLYIADDANEDIREVTNAPITTSLTPLQPVVGDVLIYPNPAHEMLTVKTDAATYNSCTISNSVGQVMSAQQITTSQTTVPVTIGLNTLPAGIYFITLKGDSGVIVKKFVKL